MFVQAIKDAIYGIGRPSVDQYFIAMAHMASTRATCPRRRVGAVFVDAHGHVLSTGYNGVASGLPHCIDVNCPGAKMASGTGLSICEALHAEENALIQLRDPQLLHTAYVTASPCLQCVRRLLNTQCKRIVFDEVYPHHEARNLWISQNRVWEQVT